jgi:hypothetical protein
VFEIEQHKQTMQMKHWQAWLFGDSISLWFQVFNSCNYGRVVFRLGCVLRTRLSIAVWCLLAVSHIMRLFASLCPLHSIATARKAATYLEDAHSKQQ